MYAEHNTLFMAMSSDLQDLQERQAEQQSSETLSNMWPEITQPLPGSADKSTKTLSTMQPAIKNLKEKKPRTGEVQPQDRKEQLTPHTKQLSTTWFPPGSTANTAHMPFSFRSSFFFALPAQSCGQHWSLVSQTG